MANCRNNYYPYLYENKNRDCCDFSKRPKHDEDCCNFPKHPQPHGVLLFCGEGKNIDKRNVPTGELDPPIRLARISVDTTCLCRPIVIINFSTIIEVEPNGGEVELKIALKRNCNGFCEILETYELEFEGDVEVLPFSFTFCDQDFNCQRGCCVYTVEIIKIENESYIDELETNSTAINAIAQGLCE